MSDKTHTIVCKTPEALQFLLDEWVLLGLAAKKGGPVSVGDAMLAHDELQQAGFKWGQDFYLVK